ncbi:nitrilase-related carbon-nitrogen hydrolase [Streptomyces virginiae]|uniref:nitrilase-related carbon-nitrogen hydrolase n=1 Tax=Streptomyces virginiae TaxID=1961 RepID=UPI00342D2910
MAAGPAGELVPADWSRAAWDVLREEAESITALAGRLGLWTVFGSIHPLTPPNRPHNSLYIASDQGQLVARYDKRFLSHTEVSFLYSPGHQPLVLEVDGIRFGLRAVRRGQLPGDLQRVRTLGRRLRPAVGDGRRRARARVAQAYGTLYNYWLGYSIPAQFSATVPSGIVAPGGRWLARCPAN